MKTLTLCALILMTTCIEAKSGIMGDLEVRPTVTIDLSKNGPTNQLFCAYVRHYVSTYGKVEALAWALRNGYSLRKIAEARNCLRNAP